MYESEFRFGIGYPAVGIEKLVLGVLMHDFSTTRGIELTKKKVDAYAERIDMARRLVIQAERAKIEQALASPDLTPEKKQDLERPKEQLEDHRPQVRGQVL